MPAPGHPDVHPPPLHSELSVIDLSAVAGEVWAVGRRGAPGPALIAHTANGRPWQLASYPSSSEADHTQLSGVHATASSDLWAVGREGLLFSGTERTHIAHGDGTAWQPVPGPDLGDGSHLSAVAAWGRDDALAVGARVPPSAGGPLGPPPVAAWDTLALGWDGAHWAAVPGPGRGLLRDVCAVGPGDYWAVGTTARAEGSGNVTLAAHFAGGTWQVGSEVAGTLLGVAATGPDDVWAVGQNQDPGHLLDPLILHYDGHAWAPTEVPAVAGQASLTAVACGGHDDVWAVGFELPGDGGVAPLILHLDGAGWVRVEPPASAARTSLQAVNALPGGDAYVAGFASSTPGDTGYTVPLPGGTGAGG
jgi:hypothetical protein